MSGIWIKTIPIRIGTDSLYLNPFKSSLHFGFAIEFYDYIAKNLDNLHSHFQIGKIPVLTKIC